MSVVELGKLCPLCVALYGINIALFAVALFSHPEGAKKGLSSCVSAPKTGVFGLSVVMVVAGVLGTQAIYSARANDADAVAKKNKPKDPPKKMVVDVGQSPSRGPADAPAVLVEFSDFECPHCKRLSHALKEAAAREPKLFRYHFKHYPMDSSCNQNLEGKMHERACAAAVAMVCAERQGRAWEMHDRLFLNQRSLDPGHIETYALSIGVDIERFRACLQEPAALETVRQDIAQGESLGVQGTPTWFINGWKEVGARDPDDLIGIIQHTLRTEKAKSKAAAEQKTAEKKAAENTPDAAAKPTP
jgi:protein-disulfide isomerase